MKKWLVARKSHPGDINSLIGVANNIDSDPVRIIHHEEIIAAGGLEGYLKQVAGQLNTTLHNRSIYPDLLLACHNKSTEFAVQLKRRSMGRTFLVNLRDPEADHSMFDLIANPTHVSPLIGDNIFPVTGISHKVTPEAIAAETELWKGRLVAESDTRLKIAVMVGGSSDPTINETGGGPLDPAQLEAFGKGLLEMARRMDAVIIASNSHRTPEDGWERFCGQIGERASYIHNWEQGPATGNPYFAMLGTADVLITTADSMSMGCEAASTGKPHYIGGLNFSSTRGDHAKLAQELFAGGFSRPLISLYADNPLNWNNKPILNTANTIASEANRRIITRVSAINH